MTRPLVTPSPGATPHARPSAPTSTTQAGRARHVQCRPTRGEYGSVSVELVLMTPLLLILVAFIVLAGRLVDLRLQVESAAHQAARAASQQQTITGAQAAAGRIAAELGPRCGTPSTAVDATLWAPGGTVTVTLTCHAALADLTLLPVPSTVEVSASFTSPLDRFAVGRP